MEDEKSFKDKQLKSSEMTMRRLHQDKEKRLLEMEKINTLDEKVCMRRAGGEKELLFLRCSGDVHTARTSATENAGFHFVKNYDKATKTHEL